MKKIVLSFFSILMCCVMAVAQNQRVTGTVVDSDGNALVGATAVVRGSNTATVTDLNGKYEINAAADAVLVFSYVGMMPQEVPVGGKSVVNVTMSSDATEIDNIVVTALGITKSEKSLGYSATTIDSEELTASRSNNAIMGVAGKVAGVSVSSGGSQAGAAQSVIIRGVSSIGNSNQPLYVVDGVPLQSTNFYVSNGYGTSGSGINSINPDDIESMTVLKGAAATALYGSRASSGVILINTKSGSKNSKTEVTVNFGVQFSTLAALPEMQNKFGMGWDGGYTHNENGSWGPIMDGKLRTYGPVVNNSQMIKKYQAVKNNIRDFFETGAQYNTSVAVQGGDANTGYYLSYSNTSDDGMLPYNKDTYDKNTLSFRGNHKANKWLSLDSSVNLTTMETNAISMDINGGAGSMLEGLYQSARDVSFVDMKDLSNIFNTPAGYFTPYGITNPYWLIENAYNRTNVKKIFGKLQADITPMENLRFTYRFGFDYTDNDSKYTKPQIALDSSYENSQTNEEGSVGVSYNRMYELNHDFLANYTEEFFDDRFDVNVTVGANINERSSTGVSAGITGLTLDTGFWDLSNTPNNPTVSESQSLRRSISLLGDVQLGWDDQVYLNLSARNDWTSTLPLNNNSFFYPGATLSWIFTNTFSGLEDIISFGKLRAAYGQTGKDPGVYLTQAVLTQGYGSGYLGADLAFPFAGYNAYQATSSLASANLQPEMTTEFEVGANVMFLNNRIGIDVAYYNRLSDMQIFKLPVDPATGYSSMTVNFGKVRNKGVELLLTTVPVQTKDFRWDLDFNWAKNNNKVESLPDGLEGGKSSLVGFDGVYMYAEEGMPIGTLYANLPSMTEDGKHVVDEYGLPIVGNTYEYTGKTVQHDWTGGISTTLRYKNFSVAATLDVRYGGWMNSRTKTQLWFTGNSLETTYNDRKAFVLPNSVFEDGTENNMPITLYNSGFQYLFDGNDMHNVEGSAAHLVERTYAKLRELSVSYDLPTKWIKTIGLKGVRVSAVGNNLFLWTPKENIYQDPDLGYTTDLGGMFGEIACMLPTRYYGFNVMVRF